MPGSTEIESTEIDADIVVSVLRAELSELRWELTLVKAKAIQDVRAAKAAAPAGEEE